MRILLDGSFDPRSADGRDAVMIALELEKQRQDVVLRPRNLTTGLPKRFTDLLTKGGDGEFDLALSIGPVAMDGFGVNARTSVVWSSHPGSSVCDLVLATDPDSVVFLREHALREQVEFCPMGLDPEVWPQIERDGPVNVGVVSGHDRVIKAWQDRERSGELVLMPPELTVPERVQFYAGVDVLVSMIPSRHSERVLQEFMVTGGVVVFPALGCHKNLTAGAWYEIGPSGWGLEALFSHFEAVTIRPELHRKADMGQPAIRTEFGWPRVVAKLLERSGRVM